MTEQRKPVVCTEGICAGAPCLEGTRLTVFNVVRRVSQEGIESFREDYPRLDRSSIVNALNYCRTRQCERDRPAHYCDGCTLRRVHDGESFDDFLRACGYVQTLDDHEADPRKPGLLFLGSLDELKRNWEGEDGWTVAEQVYRDLLSQGLIEE